MKIVDNLNNINTHLAELIANDEYTSIGYIPILNSIMPADIIAIKKAKKLLDVIVVQNIAEQDFDDFTLQALSQLDVNLVINKLDEEFANVHISFESRNINSVNLMRGILTLLPSSVFINQDSFEVFKTISTLENVFKELFSLHNISSPESVKSFTELDIIRQLQDLEKSSKVISKENILSYLSDYTVADYQDFKHKSQLFINLKVSDEQADNTFNISYCFKA